MVNTKNEKEPLDGDMEKRLQIAEKIFKEVLAADLHQSEIANRLLIPVTFLTGAATFLFRFILDKDVVLLSRGINVIPLLFLLYVFFTLCGIFIFFEVIGPSFYTKAWPVPEKGPDGPPSTLFFKLISKVKNVEVWVDYFCKGEEDNSRFLDTKRLQEKLIYDYAVESYQLAKKAHEKSRKNLVAHMFFYPSFGLLLLMAFSGVISFLEEWNPVIWGLFGVIVAFFVAVEISIIHKYLRS